MRGVRDEVDFASLRIRTLVDGEVKQDGSVRDMIFPLDVIIAYITAFMTLEPGDLIATGTPPGVGPLTARIARCASKSTASGFWRIRVIKEDFNMKFFLDTANLDELKAGARWGIIDGVTTNPSLIAKEGVAIEDQIRKICDIIDGDISAEVVATETDGMLTRRAQAGEDPQERCGEGPADARRHPGVLDLSQRGHSRKRDAVFFGGPGDSGGEGGRVLSQPVRRSRGRYRRGTAWT